MTDLSLESIRARLGAEFTVRDPAFRSDVVLRLVTVHPLVPQPGAPRQEPFALEFVGPPAPLLAQQIYRLGDADAGEIDIFLVPVGIEPEGGGVRYEAVFN